ncbi:MAG: L-threonylcarbamoyladenylate synthase [bacterium]
MNNLSVLKINPNNFDAKDLEPAVMVLQRGGVIAYPTETVYGLGANIYHERAVRRIYQLKKRDLTKPLSVMISSIEDVEDLCEEIHHYGKILINAFWPGPITLIFKASDSIPSYITSKDKKIGLRIPNHPITEALMRMHSQPVTSTSANITGTKELIRAQDVKNNFGGKIDLIIDGGACCVKIPSTVLDVTGEEPKVLREGAITRSQIEEVLLGISS